MKLLVTGGLGYIGSHTIVELINNNHEVIIADNLMNSSIGVLDKIEVITGKTPIFYNVDINDFKSTQQIFENHSIDGVIHFAALKLPAESIVKPLEYYSNNLISTMILCRLCLEYNVKRFVFSSSAAVYGERPAPLREEMNIGETTNPYAQSKAMCERILTDAAKVNLGFSLSILRYFNPIGAHQSGLIGEISKGVPNNLMPYITKVAKGELEKLKIFGNDYNTPDGTGIRDYIHVVDLAKGHVCAIEKLDQGINIYNLGTGNGTSVLELIEAFKQINEIDIPYEIVNRRPGDIEVSYADVTEAELNLGWKAMLTLEDMVRDAWRFEKNNF